MEGKLVPFSSLDWVTIWVSKACASAQSSDSVSASLRVYVESISMLLKVLLFRSFQMYHKTHANWWSSMCGEPPRYPYLQKAIEKEKCMDLTKFLREPKLGPPEDIQTTHDWLIPRWLCIYHTEYLLVFLLFESFFFTGIHPDTIYHKKNYFRWTSYFPRVILQRSNSGSKQLQPFFFV